MKQKAASPSPVLGTKKAEPATTAGFRFLPRKRDGKRDYMSKLDYTPAEIHSEGLKWFVYYYFRNPFTHKKERFKVYEDINRFHDLKEKQDYAEKLRDAVNLALKEGFNPFVITDNRKKEWTFIQALNYYKQYLEGDNDLRTKTIQSYMSMVNIMSAFPDKNEPLTEITQEQIVKYLERKKKAELWGNKTFNGYLGYIGIWFGWMVKNKIIQSNVMEKVEKRKVIATKHKAFSESEFKALFEHLTGQTYWFCRFVYHTGTRPKSETRLLQLKHVLYDRKLLFIPGEISKNKKDDYVPLADELLEWLEQYKEKNKDFYIFGNTGEPGPKTVGQNVFSDRFTKVRAKLKLSASHTIYGLKHTRAIHLAEAGVSPYLIMQLFRHSSLEVTMKYLRDLGLNVSREAVEVIK